MDSASPSVTSVVSLGKELDAAPRAASRTGLSQLPVQAAQVEAESKKKIIRDDPSSDPPNPVANKESSADDAGKTDSSREKLSEKEIEASIKEAEKQAKQLERAFARINAPFKVSFEGSGKEINFQVVEAESGKVLRKFPPPAAQSILDRLDIGVVGALVDESA